MVIMSIVSFGELFIRKDKIHWERRTKLGQMKIQQMAFMLMALTLFFILVGMFFLVFQLSDVRESATRIGIDNSQFLITKIANSPEFSCGDAFRFGEIDCVDFDKLMVLRDSVSNYEGFWGVADIEIEKVYPLGSEESCSYGNYPNCKTIKIYSKNVPKTAPVSNFISLCRKEARDEEVYEVCEIAKIKIRSEDKR